MCELYMNYEMKCIVLAKTYTHKNIHKTLSIGDSMSIYKHNNIVSFGV